jgi:hypothetical protein
MPKSEAKKSDRALPFKFSAGGIEATAIFIGRVSELTASEAYSWVKSSNKGTGQVSIIYEVSSRYLNQLVIRPESELWKGKYVGQTCGATSATGRHLE